MTYVWFDALLNYATAVGYKLEDESFKFKWPQVMHMIGKDILMTHAVYWPTILMALDLPLPKKIFAHGWWLTEENQKMSKSKGKAVNPLDLKDIVGVSGLRYFLLRDMRLGSDAKFSFELAVSRINTELANNLGNLFSRISKLCVQHFDGKIPFAETDKTHFLAKKAVETSHSVKKYIMALCPNDALEDIMKLLSLTNKFVEDTKPWVLVKNDSKKASRCLYIAMEVLRICAILLFPVIPSKAKQMLNNIGLKEDPKFKDACEFGLLKQARINSLKALFPRIKT